MILGLIKSLTSQNWPLIDSFSIPYYFQTEASFSSPSKMGENMIIIDDKREVNYAYAAELNSSMNAIVFR